MAKVAFVIGNYPAKERARREKMALAYATPSVEVGIVSVAGTPYTHNLNPTDIERVQPAFIEAYIEAERRGYDAIVPLGTLDIACDGGRSAVDIPIVAPSEAMFHIASMLGQRFGLLIYHLKLKPLLQRVVSRYEMNDRVGAWRSTGFDLPDLAENEDAAKENIIQNARKLVEEDDCDVVLPMGVGQCPLLVGPDVLSQAIGVPVVEGVGTPIRLAAMMADLGLHHSRKMWPKEQSRI